MHLVRYLGNFKVGATPKESAMRSKSLRKLVASLLIRLGRPHYALAVRGWAPMAGGDETPEEKAERERKEAEEREKEKEKEKPLGEAGQKALEREREARKAAEKEAKEAKARADALEREKLSEEEKLKKDAEDGRKLSEAATAKLRRANLLIALGEKGLHGAKAKAAARLLDGVEYDGSSDEPKNLDDRITAAKAEFGDDLFKPVESQKTEETEQQKKEREEREKRDPNLHAGPRREAGKEDEEFDEYFRSSFPHVAEPESAGAT